MAGRQGKRRQGWGWKDLETYTFWLSLILFRRTLICKWEKQSNFELIDSGLRWLGLRGKPV